MSEAKKDHEKTGSRWFLVQWILLTIYPVFFLYSQNATDVHWTTALRPQMVVFAVSACIWLIAGLFARDRQLGSLFATVSVILIFFYESIVTIIHKASGLSLNYVFFAWLVLLFGAWLVLAKARQSKAFFGRFAAAFGLMLLLSNSATILVNRDTRKKAVGIAIHKEFDEHVAQYLKQSDKIEEKPDVYCLLLDGYGRQDMLMKHYEYDNSAFVNYLESKGFIVSKDSYSNYNTTHFSLSSFMSGLYCDQLIKPKNGGLAGSHVYMYEGLVPHLFKNLGYQYTLFVPGNQGAGLTEKELYCDKAIGRATFHHPAFAALLFERSALDPLLKLRMKRTLAKDRAVKGMERMVSLGFFNDLNGADLWRHHILEGFEELGKTPADASPKFVMAHFVCPHPPYAFNKDGSPNSSQGMRGLTDKKTKNPWVIKEPYIDQLQFINTKVKTLLEKLLASPKKPIIFIVSDHGTASSGDYLDWYRNPNKAVILERMSNFIAVLGPKKLTESFKGRQYLVNVFPKFFNAQFNVKLPVKEPKAYWMTWSDRGIVEVTGILEKTK